MLLFCSMEKEDGGEEMALFDEETECVSTYTSRCSMCFVFVVNSFCWFLKFNVVFKRLCIIVLFTCMVVLQPVFLIARVR